MGNLLSIVIVWSLSTFTVRLMTALGISLTTYSAISRLVDGLINRLQVYLSQVPADILAIMSMAGVGEGLSLIASALVTRAFFVSARVFITASKR